ncbi:hypothetical protein HIV01_014885 [Lysobacter arenosi]|uniref:Uncharacterized protein n=1 Tax=Lysobacter arenosi TaxID=2795387 RepID=A0ABX7R8S3_9GAMM|nr:hypothetical protein [Lysobacter arenosi]QSX74454.1 hypothetical protein HIV01_014885 [Lysobacter arenosi]
MKHNSSINQLGHNWQRSAILLALGLLFIYEFDVERISGWWTILQPGIDAFAMSQASRSSATLLDARAKLFERLPRVRQALAWAERVIAVLIPLGT